MASFLSNLFKLTTGTMLAQIVAIVLIPVVTRIYPPEFFGVNQLFLSIAAVIVVVAPPLLRVRHNVTGEG